MCIPGTEQEVCSACIMSGSYALIENCLIHKEASFWQSNRTLCMIRYSHTSFIGSLELEPSIEVSNPMDLRMTATDFSRAWKGLTLRMGQAISSNKDTTWSGGRYYAADVAALPDSQTLYGLMQCTPDLSKADCNLCLQESVNFYQQFFLGQQGKGISMGGFLSFFIWRSAYLTRVVSWRNRFYVFINWITTFVFGRDTSRLWSKIFHTAMYWSKSLKTVISLNVVVYLKYHWLHYNNSQKHLVTSLCTERLKE